MHGNLADRRKCGHKRVSIVTFACGSLQVENRGKHFTDVQPMCNYTSRRAGKAKRKRRKKKNPPSQNSSGRLEQDFHSEASALISTLAVRSASSTSGHQQMYVDHSTIQYHGRMALSRQNGSTQKPQLMHMNRPEGFAPPPSMSMTVPMAHSSRPTLGFPLGTALLLLVIFSLSGIFSCCYHWDRLRLLWSRHPAMLQEGQLTVITIGSVPSKAASQHKNEKAAKECGLPVIMPGDNIAKFFARPCPHERCFTCSREG
ncbi:uncharacterized protein [Lolium perenne]|uniref:uncharacterized protein isoform X1 n=2 Tax=Lolium perenne TaxID=4522 RepID=UPI0021F55BC0|nr:uncharacterized protein LOC127349442 isoform X2 [Lolium perenne]